VSDNNFSPSGYLLAQKVSEKDDRFHGKVFIVHLFFKSTVELAQVVEWMKVNEFYPYQPPELADFGMREHVRGDTPRCPIHMVDMMISKKVDGWYCGKKLNGDFCPCEAFFDPHENRVKFRNVPKVNK